MVGDNHELNTQGWMEVQRICRAMLDEVAEIANTVTASIRTAQTVNPGIPDIAHRAAEKVQVRTNLHTIDEQQELNKLELPPATAYNHCEAAGGKSNRDL